VNANQIFVSLNEDTNPGNN